MVGGKVGIVMVIVGLRGGRGGGRGGRHGRDQVGGGTVVFGLHPCVASRTGPAEKAATRLQLRQWGDKQPRDKLPTGPEGATDVRGGRSWRDVCAMKWATVNRDQDDDSGALRLRLAHGLDSRWARASH